MVGLVMMLVAGMTASHGDFSTDDIGRNTGGFSVDQRGKLVLVKSESWPDKVGFAEASEALTDFLTTKGNTTTYVDAQRIEGRGRVPLTRHAGIGNYVAGDVHYTLVIEDNGSEFICWFTDLEYQPYRNDRYGKRIKATASPIPLERELSKINEPIWQKQRAYAYESIDKAANRLLAQLERLGKPTVVNLGK